MNRVCVCILAHNEERNIANTIQSIVAGNNEFPFDIKVYANGCTDKTIAIVEKVASENPFVSVCRILQASKPAAWNKAFKDNSHDILFFSDADIIVQSGAVPAMVKEMESNEEVVVACCQQYPLLKGKGLQQKLVGLMQIPLLQDFISGGFYGVRRKDLLTLMESQEINDMPLGVTGDDAFLGFLVPKNRVCISKHISFYVPPGLKEYCRYLARIKWQNKQIEYFYKHSLVQFRRSQESFVGKLYRKIRCNKSFKRLVLGLLCTFFRVIFKSSVWFVVNYYYNKLGPIRRDGASILTQETRSTSIK